MNNDDPFDELMRRSLANEANRIEPTDALPEILTRAHAVRRPVTRRPWVVGAGLTAIGTAAAIGAFTVFNGNLNTANDGDAVAGQGTLTSASGAPTSTSVTPRNDPTTAPTLPKQSTQAVKPGEPEPMVASKAVPIYWLGDAVPLKTSAKKPTPQARSTTRLYRTWTKVSGRPAFQAVQIMTAKQPEDPDYYSVWKGAEVSSVTRADGVVTVDFKQFPVAEIDASTAEIAAQQLVYTVQGALNDSTQPVQVTQRGKAGAKLFGTIDTSTPLGRAQAVDVEALVSIESPTDRSAATSPVTVQGLAAASEATVNYLATNLKTGDMRKSVVNTAEGQKFSEFTFQLKLAPGLWQIEAYLTSAADGTISDMDTKTVEVVR
ncbi:Gmad2 immunoglobulin-like domain-containing protein [Kribbella sp. NPDC051587]|uniref:Gmad2 immunoglobulin-like domain-containing protein n=1 Tax=Kribbella sp. NPDC051587 TaxID=3364119 RepID=UPI00378E1892